MCELNDKKNSYTYDELSLESQERAMRDRAAYWMKCLSTDDVPTDSNYYKAYMKSNEMNDPWSFVDNIMEYCRVELIKELSTLKFNCDGELIKE